MLHFHVTGIEEKQKTSSLQLIQVLVRSSFDWFTLTHDYMTTTVPVAGHHIEGMFVGGHKHPYLAIPASA